MKAQSIQNPYAQLIVQGYKTLEVRSKPTKHRGYVVICASQRKVYWNWIFNPKYKYNTFHNSIDSLYENCGHAIGVAMLTDCRRMEPEDEIDAFYPYDPNKWVYVYENAYQIKPFPVKGQLGLFELQIPQGWCLF